MNWQLKMAETPFGQNTRQNMRPMNSLTFTGGGRESQPIPRVGYLARIFYHFSGTLTVTLGGGTAALDAHGPYNTFNRVRVLANSGQDIYSTTGYGNFLVNKCQIGQMNYDPEDSGFATVAIDDRVFAAPTAAGANTWEFGLVVPISLSQESELGLVLLQNEMAQTTFALEYNASVFSTTALVAPVLVTGAATATLTGTITPMLEYFSVPADPNARPDISWLHQVLEFAQPIASTGDQQINLLRDSLYVDILHEVVLNATPDTLNVDKWRLLINQSDTPYEFLNRLGAQAQRFWFHQDLPDGVITYPLFNQGVPGFAGERDLINGRATSELQSIVTIATGATLGTNPGISTITRQLVKLQTPPTRQA